MFVYEYTSKNLSFKHVLINSFLSMLNNEFMRFQFNLSIKVLILLLSIFSSPLFAESGKNISLKQNGITLTDVFKTIEKQTDVTIVYNASLVGTKSKVNVDVTDQPLELVLTNILKNTNLTYKSEGEYIVIVDKMSKETKQTSNKITGVVFDNTGLELIGVSVVVKNATARAITNIDGEYEIEASQGATLVFSYMGYKTTEVKVGADASYNITMQEDVKMLDEIVVVGYNMVKLGQVTGAIKHLSSEDIQNQSSPTLENRLQGKIAGVMISSGSGQPGSDNIDIRIRGTGSINGSNKPLYIMDGVMVEAGQFAALSADDIADIQVLKDASSTAIYGSRGANGVVVITTKSGKKGKTLVTYRSQLGLSILPHYIDMMNGEQNIQYQRQAYESDNSRNDFPLMSVFKTLDSPTASTADKTIAQARLDKAKMTNTDWIDEMTKNGFLMEHNVNISGGGEDTKFFISGSFLDQEGNLKKSGMKRYSGRFNFDHKINKYIEVGMRGTIGFSEIDFADPDGPSENRQSWLNPWFTALLAYPYESPEDWNEGDNPTLLTKYLKTKSKRLKGVWGAHLKGNITEWLFAKTNFGMDYTNNRNSRVLHRDHPKASGDKGNYLQDNYEWSRYTWTNTVNVIKDFSNGHSISAVVGMEMYQSQYFRSGFTGYNIDPLMMDSPAGIGDKTGSSKNPPRIRGGKSKNTLMSYFSQVGYAINQKYNFSGSLRHDTSSKFAKGNRSAIFWSLGTSWNISNEKFFTGNAPWINYLRLRASYGTNGNQDGLNEFIGYDQYTVQGYNGNPGYIHQELGNPDLKWESSQQADIGIDFTTWDHRLSFTFDYYHKKTKDLYMSKKLSATSGFKQVTTNAGTMVNQGIELGINVDVLKLKNFNWNVSANFTYNKNELTDLGSWSNESGFVQDGDQIFQKGKAIKTWSMVEWAGVNPANGLVQFYDANGNKTENISDAPKVTKFKSSEVPYFGGFGTSVTYKGLTLSADFTYATGYYVMNASKWYLNNHHFNGNKPVYMLDMWMKPGDITDVPRFGQGSQPSPWASQFLEDASYLRFKNLRLHYQLSDKLLKQLRAFNRASVYAQAENLHTWTSYEGADPEVNGDVDRMSFPKPRNFTFGIEVTF